MVGYDVYPEAGASSTLITMTMKKPYAWKINFEFLCYLLDQALQKFLACTFCLTEITKVFDLYFLLRCFKINHQKISEDKTCFTV